MSFLIYLRKQDSKIAWIRLFTFYVSIGRMFFGDFHKRVHFSLSCLIAFTLVFKLAAPVLVTLLFINWLLEGRFPEKFRSIKYPVAFYLFVTFYCLHLISLLWSSDQEAGLFKLELKLPLLVFPFIFGTRPFTEKEIDRIFSYYVLGCALACIVLLVRALVVYYYRDLNFFLYTRLSWFLHTSYLAMYLNLGLAYLLVSFCVKRKSESKAWWLLLPLLILTIVLLSSKMGHIILFLILGLCSGHLIFRQKKYLAGVGILLLMLGIISGLWRYSSMVSSRVENTLHTLSGSNRNKENTESTAVRLFMWKAALDLSCKEPLLGTGVGSEQDALMRAYRKEGIQRAIELNLNVHNTYLQALVSLGYAGLVVFLAVLFLPLAIAIRQKNGLYIIFLLLVILNFIPESMLETQAGTMFYGFFNCLLLFSEKTGFNFLAWKNISKIR